uniref:Uncharacterized protein n=1 Tax=Lactuca sativa TaxID=4236 RepID=A0A9R1UGV1_LACSA|nr:hypothetical protein LSAT_V11C900494700 [Lactuca sativa]
MTCFGYLLTNENFGSKFWDVTKSPKGASWRPTMVANTLHAATILFREDGNWDWLINLNASDYPFVTQNDLLHTFSSLPRDLNFIDHTSIIGWKE